MSTTAALASFASQLTWDRLPETTRHAARRTFANAVGLAVDACRHPAVEVAVRTMRDLGCTGRYGVLGRPDRLTAGGAALVNGVAMHVEDFDDTHLRTVLHPGAPVVPAALVAAELAGATGRELLTGVVAGVELACRVGNALGAGHFDRGWHLTGTMGHLGAAAAAGRVLGLNPRQLAHALALAATQAAGTTEQLGTMTKSLHPGKAAADGLQAAQYAAAGYAGPAAPIEAMAPVLAPAPELAKAVAELGQRWEIEANAFKPYSCGIVSHPVIDAAIALRDLLLGPELIAEVELVVRPVVLEVMGVVAPENGLRSKFSVYHCFAVGFLDGAAGPAQYSDQRARDRTVVSLRQKVRAVTDPAMPKDACRVIVRTTTGQTHTIPIAHATGSTDRPLSDPQLRAKFDLLVRPRLDARTDLLWDAAWWVDRQDQVGDLLSRSRWEVG